MTNRYTGSFSDDRGGDISSFYDGSETSNFPYTATAFREDTGVKQDFALVKEYMAGKVLDPASLDLMTDGADVLETFRDSESRFENMIAKALVLEDAPEEIKESYRRIQTKFENIDKEGVGEWMGAIKDYGIDAITDPFNIGAVWFATQTGGVGAPVALAAREASKVAARTTLTKALTGPAAVARLPSRAVSTVVKEAPTGNSVLRSLKAAMNKNPKTSIAAIGATQGAIDDVARQNLAMTVESQEDYNPLQTIITAGVSAGLNVGMTVGIEKLTKKFKADSDMDELTPEKGAELFDEGIEGEWIPASASSILKDIEDMLSEAPTVGRLGTAGETRSFKDITPDEELMKKYATDLGGGARTVEEVRDIILAAAQTESTAGAFRNQLKKKLHAHATHNQSRWIGKASGVLSPFARVSATAKILQEKFSNELGMSWKVSDRLVGKDYFETQREIQGRFFEDFRSIVEPLATSKFLRRNKDNAKLNDEINDALMLAVRGQKAKNSDNGLGVQINKEINKASVGVKNLYKQMGAELKEAGLIENEVGDYIPRSWNRKAILENKEGLAKKFEDEGVVPEGEGLKTVEDMLKIDNQIDSGGGGGFFFSSARSFDNIKKDAVFQEFLDTDVRATMNLYTFQAAKGLAKVRTLGVRNEQEFKDFYINQIRKEMTEAGETFTSKDAERITRVYRTTTSENLNRFGKYAQGAVDGYGLINRVAYLGLATVSSLTEVFLNFSKAGFKNSFKGLSEAMETSYKGATGTTQSTLMSRHGMTAAEAKAEMRKFSLGMDMGLTQLENRLGGDDLQTKWMQNVSSGFFKITLLEDWTKFVQTSSFMSGKNLIEENIQALVAHGSKPLGKRQETLIGELAELDIDYLQAMDWYKNGAKRNDKFYDEKFLGGAARYANSMILQPSGMSNLKPYLFSNPKTSIGFQLMGYPAAFTNTVLKGSMKQITKDINSGDPRNVLKVGVTALSMVQVARIMNDWRSDGKSEEDGQTNAIYEAIKRVGGLGILADNVTKGYDAAKFNQSLAGYGTAPFGPAATDILSVARRGPVATLIKKVPAAASPIVRILGLVDEEAAENFEADMKHWAWEQEQKFNETYQGVLPSFESAAPRLNYETGGVVTDVPNVPEEPDERIDKLTGMPYNMQAGDAYRDIDDRLKFNMGGRLIGKKITAAITPDTVPTPVKPSRMAEDRRFIADTSRQIDPEGVYLHSVEDAVSDVVYSDAYLKNSMSMRTQRPNTGNTAIKALDYLNKEGATGRSLDYGAGLGLNAKLTGIDDTFEPFKQKGFEPTFSMPSQVPADTYGKIVSTNVINTLPPEIRKEAVLNIGQALKVDGKAIIQTWSVSAAKDKLKTGKNLTLVKGESNAFIGKDGGYQKGFSREELQKEIQATLGDSFTVDAVVSNISGVAVVITKLSKAGRLQKADGGYIVKSGDTLSAIARDNETSVKDLVDLNSIEDADKIYADQVLRLAPEPQAPQSPSDIFEATVNATSDTATAIIKGLKRNPTIDEIKTIEKAALKIDNQKLEGVTEDKLAEYRDVVISRAMEEQAQLNAAASAASKRISDAGGSFMRSVRGFLEANKQEATPTEPDLSNMPDVSGAIGEVYKGTKETIGNALASLRKITSADSGTSGRTASNTVGTTADRVIAMPDMSGITSSVSDRADAVEAPDMSSEDTEASLARGATQIGEAVAGATSKTLGALKGLRSKLSVDVDGIRSAVGTQQPDLSEMPDLAGGVKSLLSSGRGRTADNTTGSLRTSESELAMPDIDSEGIREAVASPVVDLTSPPEKPEKGLPINLQSLISSPLQQALSLAGVNIDPLVLLADQAKLSIAVRVFGKDSYIARSQSDDITEKDLSSQVVEAMRTQAIDMFKTGGRGINDSSLLGKGEKRSDVLDYRKAASFFTNPTKSISLITGETSKGAFTLDKDNNLILNDVYDFPDYNEGLTKKGSSPIYMTVHNMFEPRGNTGDEGFLSGLFAASAENTRNMRINLGPAPQELIAALSKEGKLIASR